MYQRRQEAKDHKAENCSLSALLVGSVVRVELPCQIDFRKEGKWHQKHNQTGHPKYEPDDRIQKPRSWAKNSKHEKGDGKNKSDNQELEGGSGALARDLLNWLVLVVRAERFITALIESH